MSVNGNVPYQRIINELTKLATQLVANPILQNDFEEIDLLSSTIEKPDSQVASLQNATPVETAVLSIHQQRIHGQVTVAFNFIAL
ncbi:hypothetical protein ACTJKT_01050 [Pseudomonas sp. 22526]|uniref:hypothetical protein n=1 Tax=Pseudomonas sp. 22526 TaxID=3453937 RepID=UPI003F824189